KPIYTLYPWSPDGGQEGRDRLEQAIFAHTGRTNTVRDDAFFGSWTGSVAPPAQVQFGPLMRTISPPAQRTGPAGTPYSLSLSSFGSKVLRVAATREWGLNWVETGWMVIFGAAALGAMLGVLVVLARFFVDRPAGSLFVL